MARPCRHYSLLPCTCKLWTLLLLVLSQPALAENLLELRSGRGDLAGLSWHELALSYRPGPGDQGAWRLAISGLRLTPETELDLELACESFAWIEQQPACTGGGLRLAVSGSEPFLVTTFQLETSAPGSYRVAVPHEDPWAELHWLGVPGDGALDLLIHPVSFDLIPPSWLRALGLDVLEGRVSGRLNWADTRLSGELRLSEGLFDGFDGVVAGEGLDLAVTVALDPLAEIPLLDLLLEQRSGEILAGSVYLPPPPQPLTLGLRLSWDRGGGRVTGEFDFRDSGSATASGSFMLDTADDEWRLTTLSLSGLDLSLPGFWQRWLDGPAAAAGFGGLETEGGIQGGLRWHAGRLEQVDLAITDLSLDDPRGRLALYGLQAQVAGLDGSTRIDLGWEAARLLGLPLGAGRSGFQHDEVGLRMLQPLAIPVLDGAVVIDGLAWLEMPDLPSTLVLDARIEPISLGLLTRQLGLLEFGGTLAGRFPGVEYQDQTLRFTGGIDIDAFSGRIQVDELTVERPFGSLPALAAQVEFQRLDLLELTGAFDFGRMEGQLSGWARDLRLLEWRPVAMDARLFTHDDARRRRISQRAVDNLSSLGGAGGAVLSGTLLRVFEDFPYRRAGLACRLSNNVCYIDGVAPHPSGGFFIVEGRGLPRLDVVGHRRLVDWPQLTRQLAAMLE